jgi:hypothetical protein
MYLIMGAHGYQPGSCITAEKVSIHCSAVAM